VGIGLEGFTVMAVIDATDKISSVIERIDGALDSFSGAADKASTSAERAGAAIDESLLQTASGADALDLAAARASAAQDQLTAATERQAAAEKELLDAQANIASEEELATAAENLAVAQDAAAAATERLSTAQAGLESAKAAGASEDALAVSLAEVTAAQERATVATTALTDAQARQSALVTSADVSNAANALTAAEKKTAAATDVATEAQERQEATSRAQAAANAEAAGSTDEVAAAQARMDAANDASASSSGLASKAFGLTGLAIAAVGYESVKAAGNWQSLTEHLVTDAGESQSALAGVQSKMLALAVSTGTSTTDIANGMYHVESAGFHGAQGIQVLTVAAQGAKVGGADLNTIAQALTGTMNAFQKQNLSATQIMNGLIATVGAGDMKMEDLGSSMGNVAAIAASAGIQFDQIGGAIATMTSQNISAQRATQDLAHTISSLENPTAVQTKEMAAMGLNSNTVSQNLGKKGLTGTIQELTSAIATHTKGGQVLISTYNNAAQASKNANTLLSAMDPTMRSLGQQVLNGTISQTNYNTALNNLSPIQRANMEAFSKVAEQTKQFNSLLTSGSPAAQTYNAAMAKMVGGSVGLSTVLTIGGGHLGTFEKNVATVGKATSSTSKNVSNWSAIQGTFNQKMDVLKSTVEAAGIEIGQRLLPVVSKIAGIIADVLGPIVSWIAHNQKLVGLILSVVGAIGIALVMMKLAEIQTALLTGAVDLFNMALDADPVTLVIIAIAALVAILIYSYTHFKTFRDIVNDVFGFFKMIVMSVVHAVEAAWSGLVTAALAVGHAVEAAWSGLVAAALAVGHALEAVWNAIASVTSTVWNAISGFFEKWWPLLFVIFAAPIALLVALWNHFGGDITSAAQDTWNAISGFFVGIWHDITSAADTAWNLFKKYVITPIQQVWAELQPIIHDIESFLSSCWHTIESVCSTVWAAIKLAIIDPITEIWQTIVKIGGDIVSAISGALHQAWDAVKDVGSWFLQIGSDIVNGIISGVENAGGALFSSLENLAGGALKAAKSFLGINSPSKLFADEVGLSIPEGIAKGINDNAALAHKAVQGLSSGLTATAKTAVSGTLAVSSSGLSALPGGTSGGAAGSGGIELYVDLRGASVMSDNDINLLVGKIGRAVATKILPQAGVHIRM